MLSLVNLSLPSNQTVAMSTMLFKVNNNKLAAIASANKQNQCIHHSKSCHNTQYRPEGNVGVSKLMYAHNWSSA